MPERVGTLLADVGYWFRTHRVVALVLGGLAVVAAGVTLYLVVWRGPSFDPAAFDRLRVGGSAASLEDDLGDADHTEQGERAVAMAWVEDGVEYYVIVRRERVVSLGTLPCNDEDASAC